MFIGHYAAAFATKRVTVRPSLGWLFAACQLPDLIWPILVLAGIERFRIEPGNTAFTPLAFDYYPWSHSLLMCVVWGALLGALYFALRRDRGGAIAIAALVVSHWVLDWITHRPDMPLLPDNATLLGLGLWNNVPATIAVETAMYVAAVWLYASMTTASDRIGRVGFRVLVAFLVVVSVANIFSPPPPSTTMVAASGLALWILVPIAAWVDRHRSRVGFTLKTLD
jgi:membrane-bound metal-dependent hydrolase YbcI (DUF457 family)